MILSLSVAISGTILVSCEELWKRKSFKKWSENYSTCMYINEDTRSLASNPSYIYIFIYRRKLTINSIKIKFYWISLPHRGHGIITQSTIPFFLLLYLEASFLQTGRMPLVLFKDQHIMETEMHVSIKKAFAKRLMVLACVC